MQRKERKKERETLREKRSESKDETKEGKRDGEGELARPALLFAQRGVMMELCFESVSC